MLVSVVVPTYNREDTIEECINSILNQDFPREQIEIIVIDNMSSDRTLKILEKLPVKTYTCKKRGPAAARNVGIEKSKGDIIAFTDSDCTVNKHWLSELTKGYKDDKVMAVGGKIEEPEPKNIYELSEKGRFLFAIEEGYVDRLIGSNMSFRREFLSENKFDENFTVPGGEENDLCLRLTKQGYKVYYTPKARVLHKPRSTFWALLKQQHNWAFGNSYFRKKHNKFFIEPNQIPFLIFLISIFLSIFNKYVIIISISFLIIYSYFVFRLSDGKKGKSLIERIKTFPIDLCISIARFLGFVRGVIEYRVRR